MEVVTRLRELAGELFHAAPPFPGELLGSPGGAVSRSSSSRARSVERSRARNTKAGSSLSGASARG